MSVCEFLKRVLGGLREDFSLRRDKQETENHRTRREGRSWNGNGRKHISPASSSKSDRKRTEKKTGAYPSDGCTHCPS